MATIREASPDDALAIGEAHAEAWRVGYRDLFPAEQLGPAVDVRRHMWAGLVGNPTLGGTLLVAEEVDGVVGFIHFGRGSENKQVGEVYGLYSHPCAWGTGSAQALMGEAVAALAERFHLAILWTHRDARRARSFYAKSGWAETGNERQEVLWDGLEYPAVEYERILTH